MNIATNDNMQGVQGHWEVPFERICSDPVGDDPILYLGRPILQGVQGTRKHGQSSGGQLQVKLLSDRVVVGNNSLFG